MLLGQDSIAGYTASYFYGNGQVDKFDPALMRRTHVGRAKHELP